MGAREHLELMARFGVAIPADKILPLLDELMAQDEPGRILSTEEAAARFGKSAEWWQDAARAGKIAGAWQDGERGPWNLPIGGCRAHLERLQGKETPKPSKINRGPWKKAS